MPRTELDKIELGERVTRAMLYENGWFGIFHVANRARLATP
jgi:hypothetical protein